MSKNYVWYSTQESRDNGTTSILAIVETIFFVALTWGVAYYYDFYTHIYTAIAIAPFLLLRTPESTNEAIELFLYSPIFNHNYLLKKQLIWLYLILASILFYTISYFFYSKILLNYDGYNLFLSSIILGIILVGTNMQIKGEAIEKLIMIGNRIVIIIIIGIKIGMIGVVGIYLGLTITTIVGGEGTDPIHDNINKITNKSQKILFTLLFAPILFLYGSILGLVFFIKSILIKLTTTSFYTFKNPINTFINITSNYNEQLATNDMLYSPELLPQVYKKGTQFQLSNIISAININNLYVLFLGLSPLVIWSFAYLYRFSIKSTAWFFFPLAYLANLNSLQDEEKKSKAIKTQTWKKLFWFNMIISAVLFLYFNFTAQYLDLLGLSDVQLNFIKDKIAQLHQYFIPQAMWLLIVAVVLYFIMNTIISRQEHIEDKEYNILTYWLIKLIFMLWMTFLAWHLVFFTNQYVLPELPKIFGMW